jgi:hypothetical protein
MKHRATSVRRGAILLSRFGPCRRIYFGPISSGFMHLVDGDKQFFAALSFDVEYFVDQHTMARGAIKSDVQIVHFEFLSTSQLRIGTLSRMLGKSRGPF